MVDRYAVKQMLTAGMTQGEVARHFGISKRTVRRIGRKPRWWKLRMEWFAGCEGWGGLA